MRTGSRYDVVASTAAAIRFLAYGDTCDVHVPGGSGPAVTAAPPVAVRGAEWPVPAVTPGPDAGLVCIFAHFSPDMPGLWSVLTYNANN
jgi:hypothetical protein